MDGLVQHRVAGRQCHSRRPCGRPPARLRTCDALQDFAQDRFALGCQRGSSLAVSIEPQPESYLDFGGHFIQLDTRALGAALIARLPSGGDRGGCLGRPLALPSFESPAYLPNARLGEGCRDAYLLRRLPAALLRVSR